MTVVERSGSMSQAFSADDGSLSVVSQSNVAGTGLASVTVHGAGLGVAAFTAMGRGGQTGCEGTEWESETSVRCMTGHGSRGTRRIVMTAGERGGTGSIGVSMDAVAMSMTRRSNSAATGSASVTVHGAGLGLVVITVMARGGQTGCEGTEWESETSVRCMLAQGARGSRHIVMTAGEQGGSASAIYSMDKGAMSRPSIQQGSNGIGVGDSAGGRARSDIADCHGTIGADRMRGLRVGGGDVNAMSDGTWSSRHQSDGDDGGREAGKLDTGMVGV